MVQDNLRTLYAAIEQGFARPLPAFVQGELERFVDCGVLARGFAVLACPDCGERLVVAFSCKGGAVTAVQRVSSDLRLNPHFHTVALDGVFVESDDGSGELAFHTLPHLTNDDVADVLQIAPARILAC